MHIRIMIEYISLLHTKCTKISHTSGWLHQSVHVFFAWFIQCFLFFALFFFSFLFRFVEQKKCILFTLTIVVSLIYCSFEWDEVSVIQWQWLDSYSSLVFSWIQTTLFIVPNIKWLLYDVRKWCLFSLLHMQRQMVKVLFILWMKVMIFPSRNNNSFRSPFTGWSFPNGWHKILKMKKLKNTVFLSYQHLDQWHQMHGIHFFFVKENRLLFADYLISFEHHNAFKLIVCTDAI